MIAANQKRQKQMRNDKKLADPDKIRKDYYEAQMKLANAKEDLKKAVKRKNELMEAIRKRKARYKQVGVVL